MTDVVAASMATPRLTGSLLTIFGGLALFLAAVGVSGVLSYLVSRRRREIGIRMALGASRANVLGLIVSRGVATAAWGVGTGILGGLLLTRLMEGLLYGVAPRDPGTFAAVGLLLIVIAVAASAAPASAGPGSTPSRRSGRSEGGLPGPEKFPGSPAGATCYKNRKTRAGAKVRKTAVPLVPAARCEPKRLGTTPAEESKTGTPRGTRLFSFDDSVSERRRRRR